MVKGWRKTLTALLCLAMMLTLTPRVSSAAVTRADAVAWAYAMVCGVLILPLPTLITAGSEPITIIVIHGC